MVREKQVYSKQSPQATQKTSAQGLENIGQPLVLQKIYIFVKLIIPLCACQLIVYWIQKYKKLGKNVCKDIWNANLIFQGEMSYTILHSYTSSVSCVNEVSVNILYLLSTNHLYWFKIQILTIRNGFLLGNCTAFLSQKHYKCKQLIKFLRVYFLRTLCFETLSITQKYKNNFETV